MKCLVYDPYSLQKYPLYELFSEAFSEVIIVSHALGKFGELPENVTVIHRPLPQPVPKGDSLLGRIHGRSAGIRWTRKRVSHLRGIIADTKPRFAIAYDIELGLSTLLQAAPKSLPCFGFAFGSDLLVVPGRSEKMKAQIANACRSAAGLLAFTDAHKEAIAEYRSDDVFLTGVWSDVRRFIALSQVDQEQPPVVFAPRGSAGVYRPKVALEAFAIAARSCDAQLRMRVFPDDLETLMEHVRYLGIDASRVELFTTPIPNEQMPEAMGRSTVMLQALLREGMGYTNIEAMAAGRVMVQPENESVVEIYPPEQRPFFTSPDAQGLASGILKAVTDADARKKAEVANQEHALANYDMVRKVPEDAKNLGPWILERCEAWQA